MLRDFSSSTFLILPKILTLAQIPLEGTKVEGQPDDAQHGQHHEEGRRHQQDRHGPEVLLLLLLLAVHRRGQIPAVAPKSPRGVPVVAAQAHVRRVRVLAHVGVRSGPGAASATPVATDDRTEATADDGPPAEGVLVGRVVRRLEGRKTRGKENLS